MSGRRGKRVLRPVALALFALWSALGGHHRALAHPELEQGKRLASELEFEAALGAFGRALEGGALSPAELVELLSERVLLYHALRAHQALHDDFVWLSALAPDVQLDLRAPPELIAQWTSIRVQAQGPLSIELVARTEATRLEARAELRGTVPSNLRARLIWRRGDAAWQTLEAPELDETLRPGEHVELYAEALGLGRNVVATRYSRAGPLRVVVPLTPGSPRPSWSAAEPEREPERARRKWLIGGACALAAAALVATVLLVRAAHRHPSSRTELTPEVDF